ncbi:hypothetical protein [Amycolatopsis sp. cmx-4-68]|uniref:hypothetical protein n=1 Tax=Amycolatopsis sp. cmx-4-68 TaxID=2790938 RepID=UPI00397CFEFA
MTIESPAEAPPAVPAAADIALDPLAGNEFVVLVGSPVRCAREVPSATAGAAVLRVPAVEADFAGLAGMAAVVEAVLPFVRAEAPELIRESELDPRFYPLSAGQIREFGATLARTVKFAVIRRIGRESHQAALGIDRIARTLLEVRRRCPSLAGGLTIVIDDAHRWDRPSLRCLHRCVHLADSAPAVSVLACARPLADAVESEDDFAGLAARARHRFFARMATVGAVRVRNLPDPGPGWRPPVAAGQPVGALLDGMGDALVLQNYEEIYRLAAQLRPADASADELADAFRLVGIADAQLRDFDAAKDRLARAVTLTTSTPFRAHLLSLLGLIETKRSYDLDAAAACYDEGLALLDATAEDEAAADVERGWLLNGYALVHAIRARQVAEPARGELFAKAFSLEFEAFALVREVRNLEGAYLRQNVIANIVFLLEITQRHGEAAAFWRKALDPYLVRDDSGFWVAFTARLGYLHCQAGDVDTGLAELEAALAACRRSLDHFTAEDVELKIAFAHTLGRNWRAAHARYLAAWRIAHRQRERDVCAEALTGMLWCLAELGESDGLSALAASVRAKLPGTRLAGQLAGLAVDPGQLTRSLAEAGITLPKPTPKSRAYIPSVDLEGAPDHDMNRFLAWGTRNAPQLS